jgi:hypothetical protein
MTASRDLDYFPRLGFVPTRLPRNWIGLAWASLKLSAWPARRVAAASQQR